MHKAIAVIVICASVISYHADVQAQTPEELCKKLGEQTEYMAFMRTYFDLMEAMKKVIVHYDLRVIADNFSWLISGIGRMLPMLDKYALNDENSFSADYYQQTIKPFIFDLRCALATPPHDYPEIAPSRNEVIKENLITFDIESLKIQVGLARSFLQDQEYVWAVYCYHKALSLLYFLLIDAFHNKWRLELKGTDNNLLQLLTLIAKDIHRIDLAIIFLSLGDSQEHYLQKLIKTSEL